VYQTAGFALNAWSRRSEVTADRAGMLCCGSLDAAVRALLQLETGFVDAQNIDMATYLDNFHVYQKKGLVRKLGEYTASHPLTPKRIEALKMFAQSEIFKSLSGQQISAGDLTSKQLEIRTEAIIRVLDK